VAGRHADGIARVACAEQHTDYARFCRAGMAGQMVSRV